MFLEKPLCKKCIPEYVSSKANRDEDTDSADPTEVSKLVGINMMALNAYQTEKS